MTIFDADKINYKDLKGWIGAGMNEFHEYQNATRSRQSLLSVITERIEAYFKTQAPTVKAISLEDLRKEIEGMKKEEWKAVGGPKLIGGVECYDRERDYEAVAYNRSLDDLLNKLEEGR